MIIIRRSGDTGEVKRKKRKRNGREWKRQRKGRQKRGQETREKREKTINLAKIRYISQGKAEGEINKTDKWNKKDKSLCTRHRKNPWNKCARSRLLSRTQGRLDVWSWVLSSSLKATSSQILASCKGLHIIYAHIMIVVRMVQYSMLLTLWYSLSLSIFIYDAYISGWLYNHHWHSAGAFTWVIL